MNEFKDMLSYLRKREKMTQQELAKKLNVATSTIGMYESGSRLPGREIEEAIADLFNVNISTLRGKDAVSEIPNSFVDTLDGKELINIASSLPAAELKSLLEYAKFLDSKNMLFTNKN